MKSKKKTPVDDSAQYTQSDLQTMSQKPTVWGINGTPPYVPYPKYDKPKEKTGETRAPYSSYSSQNMQAQKDSFLSQTPSTNIYNKGKLEYPVSKYILQAGTVFPAILQTTLDSDNPGVVMARVRSDVYDSITGQYLLLPKGSKLLGNYNSKVAPGQSTLQIVFQRFIRPDGSSMMLSKSLGVNDTGGTGISDTVDNHWMRLIGAAALMTVFNIPATVQQNQALKQNSSSGQLYGASAFGSASDSVNDIGQQFASQSIKIQPTIIIHAGKQFSAFVTKDIVIPPIDK